MRAKTAKNAKTSQRTFCVSQTKDFFFALFAFFAVQMVGREDLLKLPRFCGQVNAFGDRIEEVPPFEVDG